MYVRMCSEDMYIRTNTGTGIHMRTYVGTYVHVRAYLHVCTMSGKVLKNRKMKRIAFLHLQNVRNAKYVHKWYNLQSHPTYVHKLTSSFTLSTFSTNMIGEGMLAPIKGVVIFNG